MPLRIKPRNVSINFVWFIFVCLTLENIKNHLEPSLLNCFFKFICRIKKLNGLQMAFQLSTSSGLEWRGSAVPPRCLLLRRGSVRQDVLTGRLCVFVSQPGVWKEDLRGDQHLATSFPGPPARLLPDGPPRLLCHGLLTGRRPHDPHPQQHLQPQTDTVSSTETPLPWSWPSACHQTQSVSPPSWFQVLLFVCAARPGVPPSEQNSLQVRSHCSCMQHRLLFLFVVSFTQAASVCVSGIWNWTTCWWTQMVLSG